MRSRRRVPCTHSGDLADRSAPGRRRGPRIGRSAVVLLAPACASFDQFRDFEQRGETFKSLVGELQRVPAAAGAAS